MKNKIIFSLIILAILSIIIGLIGKIAGSSIIFANATWHMFAQTCLLAAIAFGVGKLLEK